METSERVAGIIAALKQEYPDALCALHYGKDYELMIAVRLSAQCTDARVNLVTPALFARYPTLDAFAEADVAEVEGYVHSCGFYKHKAEDIVLGLPDAAGRIRREGARHDGAASAPAGCGPENGKSAAGRYLWDARLGRLRHALHPHLQSAGPRQRQGPGKGRAAAARDFAAGGILRFLPQARPARPGRLRGKKARVRPLLSGPRTAKALRGNEHACPFYVKSLKFNRSW